MQERYMEEQLATHKTFTLLLKLTIPTIAAQILNALYNLVDRMFIGRIDGEGTLALSGLGICFPIINLVTAFAWMIGMGGGALLSISLGEKKEEDAARIQSNAFMLLILVGVTLTAVCFFFAEPILYLFGGCGSRNSHFANGFCDLGDIVAVQGQTNRNEAAGFFYET